MEAPPALPARADEVIEQEGCCHISASSSPSHWHNPAGFPMIGTAGDDLPRISSTPVTEITMKLLTLALGAVLLALACRDIFRERAGAAPMGRGPLGLRRLQNLA